MNILKNRKKFQIACMSICLSLGYFSNAQAQNSIFGPSISYQYQKGSTLKTGAYFATSVTDSHILKLDATANFTWMQEKFAVIPEVAGTYYSNLAIIGLFGRAELTPYTVTPKIGVSLATLIELDFGYGFPISDKSNYRPIKGFTTSLRFNIPINWSLNLY